MTLGRLLRIVAISTGTFIVLSVLVLAFVSTAFVVSFVLPAVVGLVVLYGLLLRDGGLRR